jgi:hypothetical protein
MGGDKEAECIDFVVKCEVVYCTCMYFIFLLGFDGGKYVFSLLVGREVCACIRASFLFAGKC